VTAFLASGAKCIKNFLLASKFRVFLYARNKVAYRLLRFLLQGVERQLLSGKTSPEKMV
jgi:hypothetical protein